MEQVSEAPPGFLLQKDYLTVEQEARLLRRFRTELLWPIRCSSTESGEKLHMTEHKPLSSCLDLPPSRLSLHYGHHFCYKFFGIDKSIPYVPFPPWLQEVLPSFCPSSANYEPRPVPLGASLSLSSSPSPSLNVSARDPDQVCLQYYPPGSGIPPHADTHSAFESLMGLSLGSGVAMEFRRRQQRSQADGGDQEWAWERCETLVPPRSLYHMSGESQYHWQHGIKKRKNDCVPGPGGPGAAREDRKVPRGERFSITFRWVRDPAVCECGDEWLCDSAMRKNGVERVLRWKEVGDKQS